MEFSSFKNTETTNTESGSIAEGKDLNDIDQIVVEKFSDGLISFIFGFLFPLSFFISILVPFKGIIIIDSKNKRIIKGYRNIYGCLRDPKIYDYYQIKINFM